MKKTTIRIAAILLIAVMGLNLVACGGKSALVGKWEIEDSGMKMIWEFTKDDKLIMSIDGYEDFATEGTYKVKGNKITVSFDGEDANEGTFKVKGDTLTITVDDESQEFKKVKK